jgi:hypothetical protein
MSRKNLRNLDLDPVDPNVKVPTAIAQLAAAADEAHRAAYGDPPPALGESPTEPPATDQQPADQDGTTAAGAQRATEAPPHVEGDAWEHRYRSLKGRFDTQSNMLQGQESRITQLEGLLASMRAAPQHNPPQPIERLITPDEERDYGTDFLDVVAKKAREDLSPTLNALASRLDHISTRLELDEDQKVEQAQQRLWDYLANEIPNWQEINERPEFLEWLALPDEYSGAIRQSLIAQAFERHDAPRVARFFNGFLAEEAAAGNQRQEAEPEPAPAFPNGNGRQSGKVPLQSLAAPGRARTGATTDVPSEKPYISTAQITAFYADVAANKYRGREAEKNQLEAMIFDAQKDGRITR